MILAIDPGNKESAYVVMDEQLKPLEFGKVDNHELLRLIERIEEKPYTVSYCAIEMVACYGMPVGKEVLTLAYGLEGFIRKHITGYQDWGLFTVQT